MDVVDPTSRSRSLGGIGTLVPVSQALTQEQAFPAYIFARVPLRKAGCLHYFSDASCQSSNGGSAHTFRTWTHASIVRVASSRYSFLAAKTLFLAVLEKEAVNGVQK